MKTSLQWIMIGLLFFSIARPAVGQSPSEQPCCIRIVDEQTGRGVPLVELRTVNGIRYFTDSAGNVAFYEPGLMGQKVFFSVTSHGYEFPPDGLGIVGSVVQADPGSETVLKIKRKNIAERIYRVTGEGIYRDSVLLGRPVPIEHPLLNAQVAGQDSVQVVPYRDRLYWFWGDTSRMSYALGHFRTAGAISELPANGGLPPSEGVNLHYFTGPDGFSRGTCPMKREENTLLWLDAVLTAPDASGQTRLAGRYLHVVSLDKFVEHGLAIFNDDTQEFEKVAEFDVDEPWRFPRGQTVHYEDDGQSYYLFPGSYPVVRVPAEIEAMKNPASYQAFTPLQSGSRYTEDATVERDAAGQAVWGWKDADPITQEQEQKLIERGQLTPTEAHFQLCDVETGQPVNLHYGSFHWNGYLKKWILIGVQVWGSSYLGEVWLATADQPTGPWTQARKIVTHDKYTFYNPTQHVFFDEEGGRIIYFEGTYASTFSGTDIPTPRYDYNQVMYRLDLSDPRLAEVAKPAQIPTTAPDDKKN